MNSSNNGVWGDSDHIEDRRPRSLNNLEYVLNRAQDQNAGGGRMNWAMVGRTIGETSETGIATDAVAKTGANATVWVLTT